MVFFKYWNKMTGNPKSGANASVLHKGRRKETFSEEGKLRESVNNRPDLK